MSKNKQTAEAEVVAEVAAEEVVAEAVAEVAAEEVVAGGEAFPEIEAVTAQFDVVDNTEAQEAPEEAPTAVERNIGNGFLAVDYA